MLKSIKAIYSDIEEYLVFSILSFVPITNLISFARALLFENGEKTTYKTMDLVYLGIKLFILNLLYVIPLYFIFKFAPKPFYSVLLYIILTFPILTQYYYKLAFFGSFPNLKEIHLSIKYWFLVFLSITVYIFFFVIHLLIPIYGWIGILYAPFAIWNLIHGKIYRNNFGL